MQLLLIPVLIAAGGYWFQTQQHNTDTQIATQQHNTDTQIAYDQQQETILKTYLDDMSDLLLTQHLSTSGEDVRAVAKERTLIALRRLKGGRNTTVLQFLQEEHLIGIQNAVLNLSDADLSTDDLGGTNLSGTNLSGADLSGANLSGADLQGANLDGANLINADLSRANLSGAHLNYADLSGHTSLSGAHLDDAFLNDADLSGAHLDGAFLNGADLSAATLNDASLNGADLSDTILKDADLSRTDLENVPTLVPSQRKEVYSCTNTRFFTGSSCLSHRVVTLTYWYSESPAETPVIRQLILKFRKDNPDIRIKAVAKPFLMTQAAFTSAVQAGHTPDVLRSDIGWVTQFASQNDLLNIEPYAKKYHLDRSDYMPVPLSYDEYNNHLYGLPQVTDFLALLYNRDMFRKAGIPSPPTTMDNFKNDAKEIADRTGKYGFETAGTSYDALPFLMASGGGMFDQHNEIAVSSQESINGLTSLVELQNTEQVMPPKVNFSSGSTNKVEDFKSGQTAMIFDGPWDISNILTGSAFSHTENLGIAAIPIVSGDHPRSPVGGQSYVISAKTAHPDEAYRFISFMSQPSSQVAIAYANHTLPTRCTAYWDQQVTSDQFISAFQRIQGTAAVARPPMPHGGHLFDAFDSNIQAALLGAESPHDALWAVHDAWNILLGGWHEPPHAFPRPFCSR